MRALFTIPFIVLIVSGLIWLICALSPRVSHPWLVRVCEILFAASALVLLFQYARVTLG